MTSEYVIELARFTNQGVERLPNFTAPDGQQRFSFAKACEIATSENKKGHTALVTHYSRADNNQVWGAMVATTINSTI
jgi:hypothetical protein